MTELQASKNAVLYWVIRLTLFAMIPLFISVLSFGTSRILWTIFTLIWTVLYLLGAFVYYPMKYKKLRLSYDNKTICIKTGVFYTRYKFIPVESVQYLTLLSMPVQHLFGMTSAIIYCSGSFVYVSSLDRKQAGEFQEEVSPFGKLL